MSHDYCKLYILYDDSFTSLKGVVAQVLSSHVEGRTVETPSLIVDCFANSDSGLHGNESFLHWPFYLEIEPAVPIDDRGFVASIQSLIDCLKAQSMRVAASCDFEDQLTY